MTNSILGRGPVVDFDGTLARLEIPWSELRHELEVTRIDELWTGGRPGAWARIARAEVSAAAVAEPVPGMVDRLRDVDAFAILTSNGAAAVRTFVGRFEVLAARLTAVVGREELGGPKVDYRRFAAGYARCARSTAESRGVGPVVYAGDADYELEFARALGAVALKVDPSTGELRDTAA